MKKPVSCVLLAISIFFLNALPVQAAKNNWETNKYNKQLVVVPGQWCFKLGRLGIFCYDF